MMADETLVSLSKYQQSVEPAAKRAGHPMELMLDRTAIQRGYFMAFSNPVAAKRYEATLPALQTATPQAPTSSLHSSSVCTVGHFVWMYDDWACGGRQLGMVSNDAISNSPTTATTTR